MKHTWRALLAMLGVLVISSVQLPGSVRADAANPLTGTTISPAIEQLQVQPSQGSASFVVTATNHTAYTAQLAISTNDFTALNNTGSVSFYGKNYDSKANPHGLAAYLFPASLSVTLAPGQSRSLPITIQTINTLATGGHYGALVYSVTYSNGGSASAQVSNNQVLSTLVFLSTAGQGTETLQLSQPLLGSIYLHWPANAQFVLSNSGNTQTTPRGTVEIVDHHNAVLSKGLLNVDSGLILPAGQRLFNTSLIRLKSLPIVAHDKLIIAYRADSASGFHYYQKSFWYINVPLVASLLLVIGIVSWLIKRLRASRRPQAHRPRRTSHYRHSQ